MTAADAGLTSRARQAGFRPRSLDAVNFLLADVRGALGPYLNVFLVTQQHWSQTQVGWVTTASGLLGIVAQTPAGAAIDATRRKRGAVVLALALLACGALVIFVWPRFWPVLLANTLVAVVGDVFGPAVAAVTLGLFVRGQLARRMGRNSAFDHAGNVAIAAAAGGVGYLFTQRAVFLLVPVFALLAALAMLSIPKDAIDENRARGLEDGEEQQQDSTGSKPSGLLDLLRCRPLLIFGVCAMLFHLANAPLLPLVGQKLAQAHPEWATAMMSSCIIAAQFIMLPVALAVGHTADRIGRKPILLIGFAVLPVRAVLYTFSNSAPWLIGVQLLDGVGAGIFGAITPLVIADLMRGTGRYNLAQGAVATAQGVGASLSGLAAGLMVDHLGYSAAFLGLGAAACLALAALFFAMPETAPERAGKSTAMARTA
ncbi:MFS transporter [Lichenicoccus roseus]|uniref:MFS transporter n=1 Tax=Lichenicoccus roseus TaxID=2683649 RepID=A0A5R9J265_9PROT|nr:MFS transporter [Lichenicoccus roseus]TLU71730.1 MFS transporter [Lichenicoccus roseus]